MSILASRLFISGSLLLAFLLSGCSSEPDEATPEVVTQEVTRIVREVVTVEPPAVEVTRVVEEVVEVTTVPTPTPAPVAQKELTICMVNEPSTLFIYDAAAPGGDSRARQAIFHAVYENLYTTLSYGYQAQGLEKLPNIDDGDAEIVPILVQEGDVVLDADNEVVVLTEGIVVRDESGSEVEFDGTPVSMPQLVVRFRLRPMVWSDGVPVTAEDSRFGFEVAAHPNTPGSKPRIDKTESYRVVDDLTLQWTGIPGWLDPIYFTNIWPPLPAHQLGSNPIAELSAAPEVTEIPLSNGPFVITEWIAGDHVAMVKNEHYYRADEGLPHLDTLTYRFAQNPNELAALLLAGECDVGMQDGLDISQVPLLIEAQENDLLVPYFQMSNVFEHIDFGIDSDEAYASTRPDWFEDAGVRQAMVACTDRQAMVDEIMYGLSEVAHAYVPGAHPLYPADLNEWPYDLDAAESLLAEAGYQDRDGDGIREDPDDQLPFSVTLGITLGHEMRHRVAQMFQEDMKACGIEVTLQPQSAADLFSPEGPVFGRRFDLAQFPWITGITPACDLYTSANIPTRENGRSGNNETGWSNPDYDVACGRAISSLVGTDDYRQNHQEALHIFSEQVPVIPLFWHLKLAATASNVYNFRPDPTQDSELWNIFEIDLSP